MLTIVPHSAQDAQDGKSKLAKPQPEAEAAAESTVFESQQQPTVAESQQQQKPARSRHDRRKRSRSPALPGGLSPKRSASSRSRTKSRHDSTAGNKSAKSEGSADATEPVERQPERLPSQTILHIEGGRETIPGGLSPDTPADQVKPPRTPSPPPKGISRSSSSHQRSQHRSGQRRPSRKGSDKDMYADSSRRRRSSSRERHRAHSSLHSKSGQRTDSAIDYDGSTHRSSHGRRRHRSGKALASCRNVASVSAALYLTLPDVVSTAGRADVCCLCRQLDSLPLLSYSA